MEIIVLNLGYEAGVISQKLHAILWLMGLFTTVITVPLVSYIYPFHFYIKVKPSTVVHGDAMLELPVIDEIEYSKRRMKILVCLISMKTVPGIYQFIYLALMTLTSLLTTKKRAIDIFALRLIELGNRMSKVK
jgi:hypothetical protein